MRARIWLGLLMMAALAAPAAFAQKITLVYPNRSGSQWPLFLAKEGGYYQKYGLDVDLKFVAHPASIAALVSGDAALVNSALEQLLQAASKDGSMVIVGSSLNKGTFALILANGKIRSCGTISAWDTTMLGPFHTQSK